MGLGTHLIFIRVPAQATAKMLLKTLHREHDGRIRCQVMRAFAKAPEAVDVNFDFFVFFFNLSCPFRVHTNFRFDRLYGLRMTPAAFER